MVITTYVNQKCIKMLLFDWVLILKKFSNFRLWCPEIAEFQNRIIDYGSQSITLSFDYSGCPGSVSCMKWTPDGTALVMAWQRGGFSIWSTFGAMIMCSLCWDYGPLVSNF